MQCLCEDLAGRRDELAGCGVRVLVAVPEDRALAKAWTARRAVPFVVVTADGGGQHEAVGLYRRVFGVMQQSGSILTDRQGVVRHAHGATVPARSYYKKGIAQAIQALGTWLAR